MQQTCRYFVSGFCKNGDKCTFVHTNPPPPPAVSIHNASPPPMACRFYLSGFCRKGTACPYLHATPSSSPPSTPTPSAVVRSNTPSNVIPFPSLLSPAPNVPPQRTAGVPFPSLLATPSTQPTLPSASTPPTMTYLSPSPCPSPDPTHSPTRSPSPDHEPLSSPSSPLPFPFATGWDSYDFPNASLQVCDVGWKSGRRVGEEKQTGEGEEGDINLRAWGGGGRENYGW